jgi:hypothetical protein
MGRKLCKKGQTVITNTSSGACCVPSSSATDTKHSPSTQGLKCGFDRRQNTTEPSWIEDCWLIQGFSTAKCVSKTLQIAIALIISQTQMFTLQSTSAPGMTPTRSNTMIKKQTWTGMKLQQCRASSCTSVELSVEPQLCAYLKAHFGHRRLSASSQIKFSQSRSSYISGSRPCMLLSVGFALEDSTTVQGLNP